MSSLGESIAERIGEASYLKSTKLGLPNAKANRPYYRKTISDLPKASPNEAAIVLVGGPSLKLRNPAERILKSGFKGTIISADGSMGYCLRSGLIPNYIVGVDGHPHRVIRWYGDPDIEKRPKDDYFSRQDLDHALRTDQLRRNRELIQLVNRHGSKIKALLSTSTSVDITKRATESGMDIYWWNPIYDDYDMPKSVTRKLFKSNKIPCLVSGGNVGTAAWVLAHAVMRFKHVALVGMDLSYAPGTPLINTQYFYEMKELLGDRVADGYIHIHNPYLKQTWFTDPTYYWYRQIFIDLAAEAECKTYNCTEGGVLFSDYVPFIPLDEFLGKFKN